MSILVQDGLLPSAPYSAFEHLWRSIIPVSPTRRKSLMAMLTVYADESGMDGRSSVVIIGGYIADVDAWDAFQVDWRRFCLANDIQVFHATDLRANRGEFSEKNGWTQKRCDSALRIVDNIISQHVLQGFVSYTTIDECEKLFPLRHPLRKRRKFSWEYCVAGLGFIQIIKKWMIANNRGNESVQFVFEHGAHGRDQMEKALEFNLNEKMSIVGGYGFQKKGDIVQLYAADRIANVSCKGLNEFRRYAKTFDPKLAEKLKLTEEYVNVLDERNWPEFDANTRASVEDFYEKTYGGNEE